MLESPQILQTTALKAAVVPVTVPRSEIRNVMGPGIGEAVAAAQAQGIGPSGPWFTHHLRMDPKVFDFEICVPTTAEVKPTGRVVPGEWPATTVARTVYVGPYEGLGAAWAEFDAWIEAQGHKAGGELWEVYLAGPESGDDASKYRTQLNRPLVQVAEPKA